MADTKEDKEHLLSSNYGNQLEDAIARLSKPVDPEETVIGRTEGDQVEPTPLAKKFPIEDPIEVAKEFKPKIVPQHEVHHSSTKVLDIPVNDIVFSPYQTREIESDAEIEGLKESILAKGVIQPIVVRVNSNNDIEEDYELVAGERRLRASKLAGLKDIPAIVQNFSDRDSIEVTIIENAQREDLDPIEEANAYKKLSEEFKVTQRDIAAVVGKNRTTISNSLRLLQLQPEIIEMIKTGELSAGHGRALLGLDDEKDQLKLARKTVKQALSVRQLEQIISRRDDYEEVELTEEEEQALAKVERQQTRLRNMLDMDTVRLNLDSQGRKTLSLTFETEASWRRFYARIRD